MRTQHVHSILPDYLTGKLDDDARRLVHAHLSVCAECEHEAQQLREVFDAVQPTHRSAPPALYFRSIVPRVRQQLEERERVAWFQSPWMTRVVTPLTAAIVVVALLNQVRFELGSTLNQSSSALTKNFSAEDVAEVLAQQADALPFDGTDTEDIAETAFPTNTIEQQIVENLLDNGTDIEWNVYTESSTEQLLNNLSAQEVETLLQRLGERKVL